MEHFFLTCTTLGLIAPIFGRLIAKMRLICEGRMDLSSVKTVLNFEGKPALHVPQSQNSVRPHPHGMQ